jgi:AcrR family transcriptional regulator
MYIRSGKLSREGGSDMSNSEQTVSQVPKGQGTDRRVLKTRRALSRALIELVLEKGYASVSVQDILDRADVGRSTFYAHFESKEMLLVNGPRNLGIDMFELPKGDQPSEMAIASAVAGLFTHVGENTDLARALLGAKGGSVIMDSFRDQLEGLLIATFADAAPIAGPAALPMLARTAAQSACTMLVAWIQSEPQQLSLDEISLLAQRLVQQTMKLI